MGPGVTAQRHRGAFTLIEMMAVVAVFGLVMALTLPNTGVLRGRALDSEARQIVALLELARQRAVMTGEKHRLWIDLEAAEYRMEWWVTQDHDADDSPREPLEYDVRGLGPLPLAAPPADKREYLPVPGTAGNYRLLPADFDFRGLETEHGWIDRGEVAIVFDQDGTSSYAELVIESDDDARALEILPLADAVRVYREGG